MILFCWGLSRGPLSQLRLACDPYLELHTPSSLPWSPLLTAPTPSCFLVLDLSVQVFSVPCSASCLSQWLGVLPLRLHPAPGAPLMPNAEVVETGYWPSQFGAPPVSSPQSWQTALGLGSLSLSLCTHSPNPKSSHCSESETRGHGQRVLWLIHVAPLTVSVPDTDSWGPLSRPGAELLKEGSPVPSVGPVFPLRVVAPCSTLQSGALSSSLGALCGNLSELIRCSQKGRGGRAGPGSAGRRA